MTKSKDSWVSILLYILIGVLIFGLIRRTWKALLVSLFIGFLIVLLFPNFLLSDVISSNDLPLSHISDNNWKAIQSEQIIMAAGMCYFFYLAFLLFTGRLLSTLFDDKFSRALREAEKISEEPGMKERQIQNAKNSTELKDEMDDFCKKYPDSYLCKRDGSKSRITDIEY